MKKFKIEIEMENDAFEGEGVAQLQIIALMASLGAKLCDRLPSKGERLLIMDSNGNSVGFAAIVEEED